MNGFLNAVLARVSKKLPLPHAVKFLIYKVLQGQPLVLNSRLTHSQARIQLDVGDFVQYWMYVDSIYEGQWVDFIHQRIQNRVFLDIGANVGNFALSLYKQARQVYAFEASSHCCAQIKKSIDDNQIGNIEVIRAAMYERSGEVIDLSLSAGTHGDNSIFIAAHPDRPSEKVSTLALDDFCKQKGLREIGLIKIDIEGAELSALKGARQTLTDLKPDLVVEFNQPVSKLHGQDVRELWEALMELKYVAYELKARRLRPFQLPNRCDKMNQNLFFSRG